MAQASGGHQRSPTIPADTILAFAAVGKADGGIMRLGKALIGNSAQKVIDGFFERDRARRWR